MIWLDLDEYSVEASLQERFEGGYTRNGFERNELKLDRISSLVRVAWSKYDVPGTEHIDSCYTS
jgi:hypothetical protein